MITHCENCGVAAGGLTRVFPWCSTYCFHQAGLLRGFRASEESIAREWRFYRGDLYAQLSAVLTEART